MEEEQEEEEELAWRFVMGLLLGHCHHLVDWG